MTTTNRRPPPTTSQLLKQERGTVHKDWGGRLPIALIFPDSYHVGMSSLALHSLYHLWNRRDDVVCERVFTGSNPPLSLESGAPLKHFPVLAFSATFELSYFNIVALLREAGIPPRATDRDESHPLIIAGGPAVSANPEPLAPLVDAVLIGEVEPVFDVLTDALHLVADSRLSALGALSRMPGLYLPQFRSPADNFSVIRQWLRDLDSFPTHSAILTPNTEFRNMGLIEIARGCGRGCRFCLAGYGYRPPRERSIGSILEQASALLLQTDRLGLVSAAVSDHSRIGELAVELRQMGARISVSSIRVDPISEPLVRALAESGTQTLTIAPEAGSGRLRQAIHKSQTEEDVLRAVELAARHGLAHVKLYFMLGLPTEEQEDLLALVSLVTACALRFPRRISVNITPFVPKAHTPFQRMQQVRATDVKARLDYVKRQLRKQGIEVSAESPAWAEVQGTLSRGDRRTGEALLSLNHPTPAQWRKAIAEVGLTTEELLASRPAGTPLPWEFIHYGVGGASL
jgi:radical SAM superfamily enzyme YgiQ (UPF0313 family)